MMDGMPVVRYASAVVGMTYEEARVRAPLPAAGAGGMPAERVRLVFGPGLVRALAADEGISKADAASQAR